MKIYNEFTEKLFLGHKFHVNGHFVGIFEDVVADDDSNLFWSLPLDEGEVNVQGQRFFRFVDLCGNK